MKIQTRFLVEFDTDNELGILPAAQALLKLIEQIDPGLKVHLQQVNDEDLTAPHPWTEITVQDCVGMTIGKGYAPSDWIVPPHGNIFIRCDDPHVGLPGVNFVQLHFKN